jgi:hypothetical protein
MDAGLAAIVGAVIGAIAGVGGSWLQAQAARTTAREADDRRREAETKDRVRAYTVRAIEETRASLTATLDFHELTAMGETEAAAALSKHRWSPKATPDTRVVNLSLVGDDALVEAFLEMQRRLASHTAPSADDLAEIQNMRALLIAMLAAQERAALEDRPLIRRPAPGRPSP